VPQGYPRHNLPQRHAFTLVGTSRLFLCHQITGFAEEHACELVLEVDIPERQRETLLRDRERNGATHILGNQQGREFTLASLVTSSVEGFRADAWTHLSEERSPPWAADPQFRDIDVTGRRVVHYRRLNATSPPAATRDTCCSDSGTRRTSTIRSSRGSTTTTSRR